MSKRDEATIEIELQRLHDRAAEFGLTKDELHKLETLIKTRALLKGEPTSISKSTKADKLSDEELMKKLQE